MNAKTDAPPPAAPSASVQRKPRFALFIATVCGLGYIPIAPGTFGSLVGVALTYVNIYAANANLTLGPLPGIEQWTDRPPEGSFFNAYQFSLVLLILVVGLWAAHQAANYFGEKDPQRVVVDEVSGQTITYLGLLTAGPIPHGWKYLLLGFILFR